MRSPRIDFSKNEILRDFMEEAKAAAKVEGMSAVLSDVLQAKFGPLPKWATERVGKATAAQLSRWAKKVFTASTLEAVLGRK